MLRKTLCVMAFLGFCLTSVAPAGNIILVTEDVDRDADGSPDDQIWWTCS